MLEQPNIARHQGGGGETEDLPEGKVPGHDRQHRTQREMANVASALVGRHLLVGQILLGVLGVMAANPGALLRLAGGGLLGFAHLQSHQAAPALRFGLENFGRSPHLLRPIGKAGVAVLAKSGDGELQPRFHLGRAELIEGLKRLTGGWIDGGDRHAFKLLLIGAPAKK